MSMSYWGRYAIIAFGILGVIISWHFGHAELFFHSIYAYFKYIQGGFLKGTIMFMAFLSGLSIRHCLGLCNNHLLHSRIPGNSSQICTVRPLIRFSNALLGSMPAFRFANMFRPFVFLLAMLCLQNRRSRSVACRLRNAVCTLRPNYKCDMYKSCRWDGVKLLPPPLGTDATNQCTCA